jgi:hypothetical protein
MKKISINQILILSGLIITSANYKIYSDREMGIPSCTQELSNTCWAACSYMVLNAYGYSTTQEQIVIWATNGANVGNGLIGSNHTVDQILVHFGSIFPGTFTETNDDGYGNISKSDLSTEIATGRPIIANVRLVLNGSPHDLLIKGYTGSGGEDVTDVIYNDPIDGQRKQKTYAAFVSSSNPGGFTWKNTLRLATNPRTPIPQGFYDWARISDGGTTTITQSTTSLSYTAIFYNVDIPPSHPVSWDWKLKFVHSEGDCIARSWTSTSTNSQLTWSISNFSLPSGYQWSYTYDGKIPGRVELDLLDSDGYHHLDAINVMYVPSDLYPGVLVYEDESVNNTRSDVRAHQLLIMQNDQFLPGGNISLKSGERIDIKDGIILNNGGLTNIIVDPTLR